MRCFHGIRGPAERCVTRHQRGSDIWDVSSFEEAADCKPGVFFVVAFDFRGCQLPSYRNGPVERIGVCCAETSNCTTRLSPSSGKFRARMCYSADRWKMFVEFKMGSKVGRRAQISIDDEASRLVITMFVLT